MSTNPANDAPTNDESPTSPVPFPTTNQPLPPNNPTTNSLLPPASLSLLLGDPGTGKSLLAIDLAARLSKGLPLPSLLPTDSQPLTTDNPSSPATTFLLSPEDPLPIRHQRAHAAGINLDTFLLLPDSLDLLPPANRFPGTPQNPFHNPSSLIRLLLEHIPHHPNFKLLILDPFPALLGTKDCASHSVIRAHLRPLLDLAAHYQFAILGISHLNKRTGDTLLDRSLGSLAYTSLARAIYLLTPDPSADHWPLATGHTRRLLLPLKHTLASSAHARAFSIVQAANGAPRLEWENTLLPHPACIQPAPDDLLERSRRERALDFLTTSLKHGPRPSKALRSEALSHGISKNTYERACYDLGTTSHHNGHTGKWLTALSHQHPCLKPRQEPQARARGTCRSCPTHEV